METNVDHQVPPDNEQRLLERARAYDGLQYIAGIGFLFDLGSFWEIRYDGCNHSGAFLRDPTNYDLDQAATIVRKEMPTCGTCESQAPLARVFANDHPA
jgi:hypothetical protein